MLLVVGLKRLRYTAAVPTEQPSSTSSLLRTLAWAVFLGVSWTWCIGMFLPVLLVRDYGSIAWWVFAVPNVVGAAAMGWMLSRQGHSQDLTASHRSACRAFSVVTIAFHLLFVVVIVQLAPPSNLAASAGMFLLFTLLGAWRRGIDLFWSILVWVISVALLVIVYRNRPDAVEGAPDVIVAGLDLAYLTPVILFGFLLCPYLDLTFHRARQALQPVAARTAFLLGFGIFFLAMIVGTLIYAKALPNLLSGTAATVGTTLSAAIALHMGLQAGFTIAVHGREARGVLRWGVMPVLLAAVIVGAIYAVFSRNTDENAMNVFEGSYRVFMAFYGLVFPAYVWICMLPTWRQPMPPTRRMLLVWLLAILVAAPMFWMGFIHRREIWLLPGIAVVLLARLAIPKPRTLLPDAEAT